MEQKAKASWIISLLGRHLSFFFEEFYVPVESEREFSYFGAEI